jgi:anti-sigma28 factor (negative regulator of flagellin synthesis)
MGCRSGNTREFKVVKGGKVKDGDGREGPGTDAGVREKKVRTLKETIHKGKYVVEPVKVAGKMVDDVVRKIRARGK